jgi:hypothetical protein
MHNEEKTLGIVLVILTIILAVFLINIVQAKQDQYEVFETHSYTKAICDSTNYCQDYHIRCNQEKIISLNPITGAAIQFDSSWQDIRSDSEINEFCN